MRDDYDRLSELGHEQAIRLGEHLAQENIRFQTFLSGTLRRQQESAARVFEAYERAGHPCPAPLPEPGWDEFGLDAVCRGISPQLARDDERYRADMEELERTVASGDRAIHRKWTRADSDVIRAWVEGRYTFDGESWHDFTSRVKDALSSLPDGPVAIATSATPIAICIGAAYELSAERVCELAGAVWNAAYTIMDRRDGALALTGFNYVGHLPEARLRTYR